MRDDGAGSLPTTGVIRICGCEGGRKSGAGSAIAYLGLLQRPAALLRQPSELRRLQLRSTTPCRDRQCREHPHRAGKPERGVAKWPVRGLSPIKRLSAKHWGGSNSHHADVAPADGRRGGGFVGRVPRQLVVIDRGPGILRVWHLELVQCQSEHLQRTCTCLHWAAVRADRRRRGGVTNNGQAPTFLTILTLILSPPPPLVPPSIIETRNSKPPLPLMVPLPLRAALEGPDSTSHSMLEDLNFNLAVRGVWATVCRSKHAVGPLGYHGARGRP